MSYKDRYSLTGWVCTICLTRLTPARSRVPALYVPIPQKNERTREEGWRRRKAEDEGPTLFSSSLALFCFTSHGDLKASYRKEKCVCMKSEDLSGGKCTTAEARAFLCIAPVPSTYSTTHSHGYIFTVSTKPSLYKGSYTFRCLEQNMEIRNVHWWVFPWQVAAYSVS